MKYKILGKYSFDGLEDSQVQYSDDVLMNGVYIARKTKNIRFCRKGYYHRENGTARQIIREKKFQYYVCGFLLKK